MLTVSCRVDEVMAFAGSMSDMGDHVRQYLFAAQSSLSLLDPSPGIREDGE